MDVKIFCIINHLWKLQRNFLFTELEMPIETKMAARPTGQPGGVET